MRDFSIRNRPHVKLDYNDPDGPVVRAQDWVINSREGIEFGFEEEASWKGQNDQDTDEYRMLLTQIYFYGSHEGVRPFCGTPPFGLHFSDDRRSVRTKLAVVEERRRSYIRDTWELDDYRMTVSYVEENAHIGFIFFTLRRPPFPHVGAELEKYPTIEAIVGLFGKGSADPAFRQTFPMQNLASSLEDDEFGGSVADFRSTDGFELGFSTFIVAAKSSANRVNSPVLSEMVFFRDRELGARGWKGPLPFGIRFDDSPEILINKVGAPADESKDEMFTGSALWHLPEYSLYAFYNTLENVILQIRIMAPGVWAAYQGA
jgi:hypothetical protein